MIGKSMKVHMIVLVEPDLGKAVEFFNKIGCDLKFHLEGKWAEFAFGDVKIGLWPMEMEAVERHTGIVFEIPDMNEAVKSMKEAGVEFVKEPVEAVHGIMGSFKSPGGNVFDLYQPTPDKVKDFIQQMREQGATETAEACIESSCCGCDDDCCSK
jgi:predicted enzyme related to lactoylglutathione lyase